MANRYRLIPGPGTIHGYFSSALAPALIIQSGDSVEFQTVDAGWGAIEQEADFTEPKSFTPRDVKRDNAHGLTGPVAISGAEPGMALEIRLLRLRTGRWGWSAGPKAPAQIDSRLGLGAGPGGPPAVITVPTGDEASYWTLDPDTLIGINRGGYRIKLRPFMGIMGMPRAAAGVQSTFPPTACGGNMDCRELVAGAVLFLPIEVEGGLFSIGDGHAVQGDGEVAGPALNCPMEVECEFQLHPEMSLSMPRARTAAGWITFGFHRDLNEAAVSATLEMLKLMGELYHLPPKEALSLASLVVNLSITQMVNCVRWVHAFLAHDAIEQVAGSKQ